MKKKISGKGTALAEVYNRDWSSNGRITPLHGVYAGSTPVQSNKKKII